MSNFEFPKNFMIGGAAAATQYEGAFDQDDKGMCVADYKFYNPKLVRNDTKINWLEMTKQEYNDAKKNKDLVFPFRWGIDFYNKYAEDFKLFKQVGINTFRTSISWSRIIPKNDGVVNQKAVDHYKKIFDEALKNNIKLVLTINHYDCPIWLLEEFNGFENKKSIEKFLEYAKVVLTEFDKYTDYWICFNEINLTTHGGYTGAGLVVDENDDKRLEKLYNAVHNQFVAQALCVKLAHKINPNNKMGSMNAAGHSYPASTNPKDGLAELKVSQMYKWYFYEVIANGVYPQYALNYFQKMNIKLNITEEEKEILKNNTVDYLTFSYYSSNTVEYDEEEKNILHGKPGPRNKFLEATEWGWQIDPIGLRVFMNDLYYRFKKPIMIVENGMGVDEKWDDKKNELNDSYRINYLQEHLKNLLLAIYEDGVECIGYTIWTAIDLVSLSSKEMSKRYGLIYVDIDDYGKGSGERRIKESGKWFKQVVDSNGKKLWEN
ncbi:glycoside hydrolase family 1 protein [Spiroplasma tabanidicola]|uniref:6-phospho-beta-glucosidase n=1 Tax=Spiroplasma tabanidicola TaxID=324079 RepID=A0A6I6C947_9MOLU|nr:glycoside hydrolase family 1 protein [Spiroplasma tabanidicola]QGS51411.1 6-phospho-beta-glucosidase [Spiroplasma tabanidicola]